MCGFSSHFFLSVIFFLLEESFSFRGFATLAHFLTNTTKSKKKNNQLFLMKLTFLCAVFILVSAVTSTLSTSNALNNKVTSRNHRTLKNSSHGSCPKTCPRPMACNKKCDGQTNKSAVGGRKRGKNVSCNHQHRNMDNTKAGTVFRRGQEGNAVPPAPVPTDLPFFSESLGAVQITGPQPPQANSMRDRENSLCANNCLCCCDCCMCCYDCCSCIECICDCLGSIDVTA